MDGALAELFAQSRIHCLRQTGLRTRLVSAHADVILLHIDDAPFDKGIHQHVLLLGSDKTLWIIAIQSQDTRIEKTHVLHQRHLPFDPGRSFNTHHFAELEHDGSLALIDNEYAHAGQDQHDHTDHQEICRIQFH